MRKEYDFTGAKRAKDVPHLVKLQAEASRGKARITILLDDLLATGGPDVGAVEEVGG